VPYALLDLPAMAGRGVVEPAFRERLADGVAGMSDSVMAGEAPLLEAALLVARVVRLVDIIAGVFARNRDWKYRVRLDCS
jgi:hypothetical protein